MSNYSKRPSKLYNLLVLLIGGFVVTACTDQADSEQSSASKPQTVEAYVSNITNTDIDCLGLQKHSVTWNGVGDIHDYAAQQTLAEIPDIQGHHLLSAYLGIQIQEATAVINFTAEALNHLNTPACQQMSIKAPIEQTLLQFPQIEKVEYAIDGIIFTEWDA